VRRRLNAETDHAAALSLISGGIDQGISTGIQVRLLDADEVALAAAWSLDDDFVRMDRLWFLSCWKPSERRLKSARACGTS
jgi:hypothetical protein